MNAGLDARPVQLGGAGSVLGSDFGEILTTSSRQLRAEMVRAKEELQAPMEEARRLQSVRVSSTAPGLDAGGSSAPGWTEGACRLQDVKHDTDLVVRVGSRIQRTEEAQRL